MNLRPDLSYLGYVLRHKWHVFRACLALGVPIRLAILHDISKFAKAEWGPYVHHFYKADGSRKPMRQIASSYSQEKSFLSAWHHHEANNKHHWGYWITFSSNKITPVDIPDVYIREMVADWIGAAKANGQYPAPETWFAKNGPSMGMTSKTSARIWELIHAWNSKHPPSRSKTFQQEQA